MLTGLDHIVIGVKDLQRAMESFQSLGFHVYPGGEHPGRGTHNGVILFDADYIGLIAPQDPALDGGRNLLASLEARGEGIRTAVIGSDDLAEEVRLLRGRGVDVTDIQLHDRRTPDGLLLQWQAANLGGASPLPHYVIQHVTPEDVRKRQAPKAAPHPNGVVAIDRVVIAVTDMEAARAEYGKTLGLRPTPVRTDSLLNAEVCAFVMGKTAVTLAAPRGGPGQEALDNRGPGPFLLAFRSGNLQETERWIMSHHINIAAAGTLREPQDGAQDSARADGVRAIVTRPEPAHGVWMAWSG